jgi:hypothetical protein
MTGKDAIPVLRSTRDHLYRYFSTERVEKQFLIEELIRHLEEGETEVVPEFYVGLAHSH